MGNIVEMLPPAATANKPKLLDQVRDVIRRKHFSVRTERAYTDWIRRYIPERELPPKPPAGLLAPNPRIASSLFRTVSRLSESR